jgi:hypothetical protein
MLFQLRRLFTVHWYHFYNSSQFLLSDEVPINHTDTQMAGILSCSLLIPLILSLLHLFLHTILLALLFLLLLYRILLFLIS